VHVVVGATNAELEALYSLAAGLVFPSLAEGFGWPVAEAQACGCPVFTSDRAPLPEVGGDAAVYFDPSDSAAAAELIALAWPERERLAAAGLERATAWSPARMIERYTALYRRLAHPTRP
jgi:glycosyltransferase involved in cell wall biosynthesis